MESRKAGDVVRRAREAAGISQTELAKRAGLTQSNLSHIERGVNRLGFEVAARIADALGISRLDLLQELVDAVEAPA